MTWKLSLENGILYLQFSYTKDITLTPFYKLKLKCYVDSIDLDSGLIVFNQHLGYMKFERIINICTDFCRTNAINLVIDQNLDSFINERQLYIEKRYRLGNEIKVKESKLLERFSSYADIVSKKMDRKLRAQQMWDSFFMCSMLKAANFSVPGSGKTSSVLGVFAYLNSINEVKRIIVICPKNAFGSWIDEFNVCFQGKTELKLLNIHSTEYSTSKDRKRALTYDSGNKNLILINYESLRSVYKEVSTLAKEDTLLVYDEVHKVKRINGQNAKCSLEIAEQSKHTIVMTGTPIPNGYIDIYNMLHLLFPYEYNDFFGFNETLLKNPSEYEIQEINKKIQPFFCRTTKDQLGVPAANDDIFFVEHVSDRENRIFNVLKSKYRNNKLSFLIRILQLESNPYLLLDKLDFEVFKYFINDEDDTIEDFDIIDYRDQLYNLIANCPLPTKYVRCINETKKIVEQGKPLVIWCIFKDTIERLTKSLNELGINTKSIFGEVPLEERWNLINDFKSGKIQVLITNPHTLAESVSLHTVCHDAIYYEYSYNLVHLLQSKDRIHRLGLPENQYTQYHYLISEYTINGSATSWSLDKEIYNRLLKKEELMLNAIRNNHLEIMPTDEEDLDLIFSGLCL